MQQNAGTLLLNGVVQIVTSHVGNNTIPQGEVPEFMRSVSRALVECLIDANRGLTDQPVPAQQSLPSAPAPMAAIAPPAAAPAPAAAVQAPAPAAVAPAPQAVETTGTVGVPEAEAPQDAVAEQPVAEASGEAVAEADGEGVASDEPMSFAERFKDLPTEPKVPIGKSITPDGIVCLFDGQPRKMLHRHILAKYGMSPEDYRTFWNLPPEYPMTAPSYSAEKRIVAKAQGLGTSKLYDGVNARKAEAERQAEAAKAAKSARSRKASEAPKAPAARKSRAKQVA